MIFLASRSPRRLALLQQIGIQPAVLDIDLPEVRAVGEPPLDYVSRVARGKAGLGLMNVAAQPGALVLAADTEVIVDDAVLGKPEDVADAARMLRLLSGRTHTVASVVWLVSAGSEASAQSVSEVRFGEIDDAAIQRLLDGGDWQGKAGGYAIQGRAAAFIEHLSGSYSGVMGLPLFETRRLLQASGVLA